MRNARNIAARFFREAGQSRRVLLPAHWPHCPHCSHSQRGAAKMQPAVRPGGLRSLPSLRCRCGALHCARRVAAPPRTHHCRTVPVRPCCARRAPRPHRGSRRHTVTAPTGPGQPRQAHPLLLFFLPSPASLGLPPAFPGAGSSRGGAGPRGPPFTSRGRGQREAPRPRAEGTTQHAPRPAHRGQSSRPGRWTTAPPRGGSAPGLRGNEKSVEEENHKKNHHLNRI